MLLLLRRPQVSKSGLREDRKEWTESARRDIDSCRQPVCGESAVRCNFQKIRYEGESVLTCQVP
eukprot:2644876-Rhodomonas_salina.2